MVTHKDVAAFIYADLALDWAGEPECLPAFNEWLKSKGCPEVLGREDLAAASRVVGTIALGLIGDLKIGTLPDG